MVLIMSYELYYETHVCLLKLLVLQSRIYIFIYIYELFTNKVVSEVSKEMRSDSPFKLLDFEELPQSNTTPRWNSKRVFAPIVSRTLVKIKSSMRNADSAQATKNFRSSNTPPPFRGIFSKTNQQVGVFTDAM